MGIEILEHDISRNGDKNLQEYMHLECIERTALVKILRTIYAIKCAKNDTSK